MPHSALLPSLKANRPATLIGRHCMLHCNALTFCRAASRCLERVPVSSKLRQQAYSLQRRRRPRVPLSRSERLQQSGHAELRLFDHLIGAGEQCWRDSDTELFCRLEIDHQFILGRRLHREVGRLLALEDAVDIASGAPTMIEEIRPVGDEAAIGDEGAFVIDPAIGAGPPA